MTDHPMIFSGPMIRALIEGRKSQTRRVLEPQPDFRGGAGYCHDAEEWGWEDEDGYHISVLDIAPNGYRVGDRIWVRETWSGDHEVGNIPPSQRPEFLQGPIWYWADAGPDSGDWERPRPSIHMPRWASRLTLVVTDVRVQRLQEISDADAQAEGAFSRSAVGDDPMHPTWTMTGDGWRHDSPRAAFGAYWDSLNAKRAPWSNNPWVCALSFTVHHRNIGQMEGGA